MPHLLRTAGLKTAGTVLIALLGVGCTERAPPPPLLASPAPAGPVAVDGTYLGSKQLVRGGNGPGILCGTGDPVTIKVVNRAFRYVLNQPEVPYQPTRTFDAAIDDAGVFGTGEGAAYMRGQASGGHMQGEISGDACGYIFQADLPGS